MNETILDHVNALRRELFGRVVEDPFGRRGVLTEVTIRKERELTSAEIWWADGQIGDMNLDALEIVK